MSNEDIQEIDITQIAQAANALRAGAGAEGLTMDLLNNPEFMMALQDRLGEVQGHSSGYIESLPKPVKRRVNALKNIQAEHVALEVEYQKEVAELERKYLGLYKPLYEKRKKIVTGEYEPTDEECVERPKEEDEDDEDQEDAEAKEKKEKEKEEESTETDTDEFIGIENFWLTALANCPEFSQVIEEHDMEALESLVDITVEFLEGANTGFQLNFVFKPNDFFENTVLTKKYTLQPELDGDDLIYEGPVLQSCTGCTINWKNGKKLTEKTVKKKQRKKTGSSAGKTRTITTTVRQDSFFHFFSPPQPPTTEEDDEEEDDELQAALAEDYELGDCIKEKIIPAAVLWFTGEALEYDDYDESEGDELDDEYQNFQESMAAQARRQLYPTGANNRNNNAGNKEGEDDDDDDDDEDDPDYQPPAESDKPPECKTQ